jgi:hypothetical protein
MKSKSIFIIILVVSTNCLGKTKQDYSSISIIKKCLEKTGGYENWLKVKNVFKKSSTISNNDVPSDNLESYNVLYNSKPSYLYIKNIESRSESLFTTSKSFSRQNNEWNDITMILGEPLQFSAAIVSYELRLAKMIEEGFNEFELDTESDTDAYIISYIEGYIEGYIGKKTKKIEITITISKRSFLIEKIKRNEIGESVKPAYTFFSNYKMFGSFLIPTEEEKISANGSKKNCVLTEFETNVSNPDVIVDLP